MIIVLLMLLALAGHAFLWIGLVNRLHSVGIRRRIISVATLVLFLCASLIPIGISIWCVLHPECFSTAPWQWMRSGSAAASASAGYVMACWLIAPLTLVRFVLMRFSLRQPAVVRFHGRRPLKMDLTPAAIHPDEIAHHHVTRLPQNETLRLEVSQWALDVPRLQPSLDGLSIVHISDLHYTGRVGKAYFREVVRACNDLKPDLVCITGDLLDRPIGFDWIADTLGRLTARHGVYFVLGNHDLRVDFHRLLRTLKDHGLVHLGGRWQQIKVNETPVVLVGNERPWIIPAKDLAEDPPPVGPLRIVLSHSPDQFGWARAHDADLILAGHTHGGQIRIPPLGAIMSPSRHGVKYIAGIFYTPPTIMHVTRGVSGDIPLRWNCPPEIGLLKLHTAGKAAAQDNPKSLSQKPDMSF